MGADWSWIVEAAASRGLPVGDARLFRDGTATLVRLPGAGLLLRGVTGVWADRAEAEVAIARALERCGAPIGPLAGVSPQPITEGPTRGSVTVWRWIDADPAAPPVTPRELGELARDLHDTTAACGVTEAGRGLRRLDPLQDVVDVLKQLPGEDRQAAWLRGRAAELLPAWSAAVADATTLGIVHGDCHPANALRGPDGPVLIDLELSGVGPAGYDAVPMVVAARRYGASADQLNEFLDGLSRDPRRDEGFPTLIAVYELWVTAWAVANRHLSPAHRAEADLRMGDLQHPPDGRPADRFPPRPAWSLR